MGKDRRDEKKERLEKWKRRLERDRQAYEREAALMRQRDAIYNGTAEVDGAAGRLGTGQPAASVYNIAYELIEGQVDSNLPAPRVTAPCEEDAELAIGIEEMLRAKLDALPFEEFNDMDERNCYNQGGSYALVEWDFGMRRHAGLGELRVSNLHPLQVIPQNGVLEIDDMDYIFVRLSSTRQAVKRRYGVDVGKRQEEAPDLRSDKQAAEDLVTVNVAYYRNDVGGIGRYVWACDTELEALEDYEVMRVMRCGDCGAEAALEETVCPQCGGKRLREEAQAYEELMLPVQRSDGSEIPAESPVMDEAGQPVTAPVLNPDGSPQLDSFGAPVVMPVLERTRIPRYRPGRFPVVLRRNVSRHGRLLGSSDIDVVRPQQDAVKKLTTNILEKLLKGGSYVTLPAGVRIETSDRQLKVLRIENPAQKALIDVLNIQPNISFDMAALNDQYERARSALGITNSFQGKPDSTAQSGVAKQFLAAQSAGRLESKRRMKQAYYQRIFEMMFRFMLAYSDGPVRFKAVDERGKEVYAEFNRYDFLKQDEAGEWYWNDEFLFSVDATGGLAQNREAMWAEAERKYTCGAMGDPKSDDTRIMFWTLLEQLQFPLAKAVRRHLAEAMGKQQAVDGAGQAPPVQGMTPMEGVVAGAGSQQPMDAAGPAEQAGMQADVGGMPRPVNETAAQLAGLPVEQLTGMPANAGGVPQPVNETAARLAGLPLEQLTGMPANAGGMPRPVNETAAQLAGLPLEVLMKMMAAQSGPQQEVWSNDL